jgi:hypothetical protein
LNQNLSIAIGLVIKTYHSAKPTKNAINFTKTIRRLKETSTILFEAYCWTVGVPF